MAATRASHETQETINQLNKQWVWVPRWQDSSNRNTAGRIVHFKRTFDLPSHPSTALLHFSADTRYKLFVNGVRVAIGPARGSPAIWYYDALDIAPFLRQGQNVIHFAILRYFAQNRAAMPFERTLYPGLTVCGSVFDGEQTVDLSSTSEGWTAETDDSTLYPVGLIDDGFLHISERVAPRIERNMVKVLEPYNFNTKNGDLLPWRLRPRIIPMPKETKLVVNTVRSVRSLHLESDWTRVFSGEGPLRLAAGTLHSLELQADTHSTAFTRWDFRAEGPAQVRLKVMYTEGYEHEPRSYPFFRSKGDRLDASGHIIGPYDQAIIELSAGENAAYEPFWFRTFRVMKIDIEVGSAPVDLLGMEASQTNYPLHVKAMWKAPGAEKIWEVSVRTLRNCMHDAYSDCPFYEQLQYSMDSRSVGLFHYLLSGDDRLMRQTLINFASSTTFEGLTQSRYPSHVPQLIAGFSLYWVLQVCDHYLYFGDTRFTKSFLPRIDGILEFFDAHIDDRGLVSGLPEDVWQFVDWVTTWGATEEFPDKGVPLSGRKNGLHTYFSMLYAYVLKQAAQLLWHVCRPSHSTEYEERAESLIGAIRKHCYDGSFFTDSIIETADDQAYSEHCQVWAVLSGAAQPEESQRLLRDSMANERFSKCSYMMRFYTFRALAAAGDEMYESCWELMIQPWRNMIDRNLSTWEEDDVRQRSDCHAWGSVPIYEFYTEIAGVTPTAPGATEILFKPRLRLSEEIEANMALGANNMAHVSWESGAAGVKAVKLHLDKVVRVYSQLPRQEKVDHGETDQVNLTFTDG